jgi:uncharacterized coiled-coil protein SlyX
MSVLNALATKLSAGVTDIQSEIKKVQTQLATGVREMNTAQPINQTKFI